MDTVKGTYKNTAWNDVPYVETGPRLSIAEKEAAYDGGLQGQGVLRYSVVQLPDGTSQFTGHQHIAGRLGDRAGAFVVEENGTGTRDGARATWRIVPGSGSGDLDGVTGEGSWTWEMGKENVDYTLSYGLLALRSARGAARPTPTSLSSRSRRATRRRTAGRVPRG